MTIKLMTIAEACDELALSRSSVLKLLREGAFESVKIGRSRRILRTSLDEFVERIRDGAPTPFVRTCVRTPKGD